MARRGDARAFAEGADDGRHALAADLRRRLEAEEAPPLGRRRGAADEGFVAAGARVLPAADRVGGDLPRQVD